MNCDTVSEFPNNAQLWRTALTDNIKLFKDHKLITTTEYCDAIHAVDGAIRELSPLKRWSNRRERLYELLESRLAAIIEYACLIYILSPDSIADYCMYVRCYYSTGRNGKKKTTISSLRIKCNYVRDIPIYAQVWEEELAVYLQCPILTDPKQMETAQKRIIAMRELMSYISLHCQMVTALQNE